MPGPLVIPAIAAGSQLLGQAVNAISQSGINKKTREWNEQMYNRQRQDALADWARTNEYNSPLAQMQRLREAGLNPHLVYGGGANSVSAPIRSTDVKTWNPQAPAFNFGQIFDQYMQSKQAGASIDIMQEQKQKIKAEVNQIDANTLRILADTTGKDITNKYLAQNIESQIAQRDASRVKLQTDTSIALDRNEREALRNSKNIEYTTQQIIESKQRVSKSQQEIENLKEAKNVLIQEGVLKKIEAMHQQMGIDNSFTTTEWIIAQFIYDPKAGVEKINQYIKALEYISKEGIKTTGKSLLDLAQSIFGIK
jgi:urease gamma subunit